MVGLIAQAASTGRAVAPSRRSAEDVRSADGWLASAVHRRGESGHCSLTNSVFLVSIIIIIIEEILLQLARNVLFDEIPDR